MLYFYKYRLGVHHNIASTNIQLVKYVEGLSHDWKYVSSVTTNTSNGVIVDSGSSEDALRKIPDTSRSNCPNNHGVCLGRLKR